MYALLVGEFPFSHPSMLGLFEQIRTSPVRPSSAVSQTHTFLCRTGPLQFSLASQHLLTDRFSSFLPQFIWPNNISPEALDLMKRMLNRDVMRRITVTEALDHPWFSPLRSSVELGAKMPKGWDE